MRTLSGLATARGLVSGPVFVYRDGGEIPIPEYKVPPGMEQSEIVRFKRAHLDTKRDLENLVSVLKERAGRQDVMVFECHLMILEDVILMDETEKHIIEDRLNAEAAVRKTADIARAKFERMNDPYFRERVRDLDDVERRLLKALTGFGYDPLKGLDAPAIIVADDLTPSETVQLPREFVLGFATDGGSTTSHVALLARAMGIPAVTGLGNVTEYVKPGERVLLDGTAGTVTIDPDEKTVKEFNALLKQQKAASEFALSGSPAGTLKDGGEILIYANIHPGLPIEGLKEHGARGVGLYRSEYLWLNLGTEPSEEEQFLAYSQAAKVSSTLSPVSTITIRVLDIGGDKIVRGISQKESNPFLGNRSIRYLLSSPETFRTQLRAILRASVYGRVRIMYPMVSCVEELLAAEKILNEVKCELDEKNIPYDRNVAVGAMIEVPAAAVNADSLARHLDFFSIGKNDLVQYTMAADRGNDSVAYLYQPTNPAVIKLMRMTIEAAKRNSIGVSVCGESAADPVVGVLWGAMGVDQLSMSATYIPVMANLFSRLTRKDLDEYLKLVEDMCNTATGQEILDACTAWMAQKIPEFSEIAM
jgi:phosphotransferase system enzyme I (PtsI)